MIRRIPWWLALMLTLALLAAGGCSGVSVQGEQAVRMGMGSR